MLVVGQLGFERWRHMGFSGAAGDVLEDARWAGGRLVG